MVSKRLGKYIKAKELTFVAFEKSINVSHASISRPVKEGKSIGSHVLEKIAKIYPDLNPTWLLTGKGDMIVTPKEDEYLSK